MSRSASISRSTAETQIQLQLDLDGTGQAQIETGVGFFNHMLTLLAKHGIPVVALDLADAVQDVKNGLRKAYGDRFDAAVVDGILDNITVVQGGIDDLPKDLPVGFVFEAIPERLNIKHAFYAAVRARDPEAFIFSATCIQPESR